MSAIVPIPILAKVIECSIPNSCNLLNPYNKPPNPMVDNKIDDISTTDFCLFVTFRIKKTTKIKINTAIGNDNKNKERHAKYLINTPDNGGPTAGATLITIPAKPIA